jgi:hypothetical protein
LTNRYRGDILDSMLLISKCRVCQVIQTADNTSPSFLKREFNICRNCNQTKANKRYLKQRKEIMQNLGGQCQCCGIANYELLSIDHIFGNGHQESKKLRGKSYITKLYYMSIQDLKAKYQCLCFNCNYVKGFNGKCPHSFANCTIPNEALLIGDRTISNTHLPKEEKKARELQLRQIQRLKARLEMVDAYGIKCSNCNETHPLFMTLDHINNNGHLADEKGAGFYQYLKRLGYPGKGTQLQLMCHNCNARKEYIDNRLNKTQSKSLMPEIYVSQLYSVSQEYEEKLWMEARKIFYLLNQ